MKFSLTNSLNMCIGMSSNVDLIKSVKGPARNLWLNESYCAIKKSIRYEAIIFWPTNRELLETLMLLASKHTEKFLLFLLKW